MNLFRNLSYFAVSLIAFTTSQAQAAVRLTAMQIISTDQAGKIQGVGAHRFKTTNHGGQPCIFLVRGDDLDGAIINGPTAAQNGIDIPLSAGTYTFTILAEKYNSYTWAYYTLNLNFDLGLAPQISAFAPLHVANEHIFPAFSANSEFTENLAGGSVKAPGTLVYKSGTTQVKLTGYHFSTPTMYNKDRVSPFESKPNKTLDYVGEFTLEVSAPPEITPGGVVNAASFTTKVAPGSLFSIFGTSLALTPQSATNVPLPGNLAGTSVTIGGKPAPLVFVSQEQINAQIPYEVPVGSSIPVVVTVNGVASAPVNVEVMPAAPGIFQFGQKRAVVQNQDYTVNNSDNGAETGSYVIAYLTGPGVLDNPVPTGQVASGNPLSRPKAVVTATINGVNTEILFAGMTPGFTGLMQVNMKVPFMSPGSYPLVVTVNGEKSNAAMFTVK